MASTMKDALTVSPKAMVFTLVRGTRATVKLRLLNRGTAALGFKVKTTQRMRYTVKPSQGLVAPSETAVVTVSLSKDECESLLYNAYRTQREIQIKDKFQVHWIGVEGDAAAKAARYQRRGNSKRLVSALAPLWDEAKRKRAAVSSAAELAAGSAADDAAASGGGAKAVAEASSAAYDEAVAAAAAAYASFSLQCAVEYPPDGLLDPYVAGSAAASSPAHSMQTGSPQSTASPRWGDRAGGVGFGAPVAAAVSGDGEKGRDDEHDLAVALEDEVAAAEAARGAIGSGVGSGVGGAGAHQTIAELLRLRRSNIRMEQLVLNLEVEKASLCKSLDTTRDMNELMRESLAAAGILVPDAAAVAAAPPAHFDLAKEQRDGTGGWRMVHVILVALLMFLLGRVSAGGMSTAGDAASS